MDPYDSTQYQVPHEDTHLALKEVTGPHPVQHFEEYYDSDDSENYYAPIETYKQYRDKDRTTPPEEKVGHPHCIIFYMEWRASRRVRDSGAHGRVFLYIGCTE